MARIATRSERSKLRVDGEDGEERALGDEAGTEVGFRALNDARTEGGGGAAERGGEGRREVVGVSEERALDKSEARSSARCVGGGGERAGGGETRWGGFFERAADEGVRGSGEAARARGRLFC